MSKHEEFLKFNGHDILYMSEDGKIFIALKPICEALGVSARRSIENARTSKIYGSEYTKQCVQVQKKGKKQGRQMGCLPEHLIYGWIFTLNSNSPELISYQKTCCEVLNNHFHGTIGNRKELVAELLEEEKELKEMKNELVEIPLIVKIKTKQKKVNALKRTLNKMDIESINQSNLFN